jgi:hypothetical protein
MRHATSYSEEKRIERKFDGKKELNGAHRGDTDLEKPFRLAGRSRGVRRWASKRCLSGSQTETKIHTDKGGSIQDQVDTQVTAMSERRQKHSTQ